MRLLFTSKDKITFKQQMS